MNQLKIYKDGFTLTVNCSHFVETIRNAPLQFNQMPCKHDLEYANCILCRWVRPPLKGGSNAVRILSTS